MKISKVEHGFGSGIGYSGNIHFITNQDMEFALNKVVVNEVHPGNTFHTYILDMSTEDTWRGRIRKLQFSPLHGKAKIEIDFIRFLRKGSIESTPTPTPLCEPYSHLSKGSAL